MLRLTDRDLAWLSAFLIALYVFDVPRLIIEIWGLPLPPLGGRPPYMLPVVAVLGLAMISVARRIDSAPVFGPVDLLFAAAWAIGAAVTGWHWIEGANPRGYLLVDVALFYSGYVLVRAYRDAIGELAVLFACLFWSALLIAAGHLLLLVLHGLGLPPAGARPSEFLERNGISFLLVYACFHAWFLRPSLPPLAAHVLLPFFALLHFVLNGARGALIVLAVLAISRYLLRADRSLRGASLSLSLAVAALLLMALGLPFAIVHGEVLLGSADDHVSALSRLATNMELMTFFAEAPLLGVGEAAAQRVSFAGYPSHTIPVILLAAFGLIGVVPLVVVLVSMAHAETGRDSRPLVGIALVLLVGLFVNDLWPWLAVAIAAVGLRANRRASLRQTHGDGETRSRPLTARGAEAQETAAR